jgi:hypothetical protein
LVCHLEPKAGQIEIRCSKHVISYYLSGITATLVSSLPTFVNTRIDRLYRVEKT